MSIVILFTAIFLLWKLWHSQIDVGKSARNVADAVVPKLPDALAVRDQNTIYQNGEKVGDVHAFTEEDATVTFMSIANTQNLKFDKPFEFRRLHLSIIKIESQTGMKSDGRKIQQAVLEGVVCKRLP